MTLKVPVPRLPVHCCCDPSKRLGWVPVDAQSPREIRFCTQQASYALTRTQMDLGVPMKTPARYIETEIMWLNMPPKLQPNGTLSEWDQILAVKSNDYPIEEWRKVVGFIEDNRAGNELVSHVCSAPVRGSD